MRGRGAQHWLSTAGAVALAGGALVALTLLPQPAPVTRAARPPASGAALLPSAETPSAAPHGGPLHGSGGSGSAARATGGTAGATARPSARTGVVSPPRASTVAPPPGNGPLRAAPAGFLPLDACAARSAAGAWSQVACDSPAAYARVIDRFPAGGTTPAPCPSDTDYALALSTVWTDGRATEPAGTACLRTLRPPHPSDPGRGGGVGIVVGDCLYGVGGDAVRETACDGSGPAPPRYRVIAITPLAELLCPLTTQLLITIQNPGEGRQTACAIRL